MAIILSIVLILSYFFFIKKDSPKVDQNSKTQDSSMESENNTEEPSYVEEYIRQSNDPIILGDNIKLSIISPEEETFIARQARMWQASISELNQRVSGRAICHWKFYLNENNDEVLYQEMENSSIISKDDLEICGFTSTFIEKRGKLRAKLDIDIQNIFGDILGTYSAEKNYIVL